MAGIPLLTEEQFEQAKQKIDSEITNISDSVTDLVTKLATHLGQIVQTDEVNSSEKYPSAAVTYAHGQAIALLNNKLALSKVVSGTMVGEGINQVILTAGTFLVVTQRNLTNESATIDIVSATSSIYAVTNIISNSGVNFTADGLELTMHNLSVNYTDFYVYKLL